jgi:cytochrome c553
MVKKHLLVSGIIAIVTLCIAAGIYAKDVPEMIELNDPAYEKHKKSIVTLSHQKHQTEYAKQYPEFYKNGCGECHHDEDNKPLTELKEGDDVQKCIECHKIPAEMPKKDAKALKKKLSKEELKSKKLEYQAEAFHYNCKDCHKKYNKKYKPEKAKKAPTTCKTCHPKKKKS